MDAIQAKGRRLCLYIQSVAWFRYGMDPGVRRDRPRRAAHLNSLHTNAYDEAITTPTEESVRRAMAIQLIINRELGIAKNENPNQGSFLIEELTDLVEESVMAEFNRLSERGGVLGAMERMYQRNKIQEESLYYETLKHTGEFPIVGVNTFLNKAGSPTILPQEVIRSTTAVSYTHLRAHETVLDLVCR